MHFIFSLLPFIFWWIYEIDDGASALHFGDAAEHKLDRHFVFEDSTNETSTVGFGVWGFNTISCSYTTHATISFSRSHIFESSG